MEIRYPKKCKKCPIHKGLLCCQLLLPIAVADDCCQLYLGQTIGVPHGNGIESTARQLPLSTTWFIELVGPVAVAKSNRREVAWHGETRRSRDYSTAADSGAQGALAGRTAARGTDMAKPTRAGLAHRPRWRSRRRHRSRIDVLQSQRGVSPDRSERRTRIPDCRRSRSAHSAVVGQCLHRGRLRHRTRRTSKGAY